LKDSQHDGTWQPSAISKINGFDVIDYLDDFAAKNAVGSLEPHADFNQLMTSPAQDIQSIFSTWGGGATFYPGDTLTFLLENGTQVDAEWLAIYNYQSETGALQTGGDFYNFFVLGVSTFPSLQNSRSTFRKSFYVYSHSDNCAFRDRKY
jgi:hypothetical protein